MDAPRSVSCCAASTCPYLPRQVISWRKIIGSVSNQQRSGGIRQALRQSTEQGQIARQIGRKVLLEMKATPGERIGNPPFPKTLTAAQTPLHEPPNSPTSVVKGRLLLSIARVDIGTESE